MGIKSLSKFLKDKYPQIFEEIHISEYAYKKIAIDLSLYLCRFKVMFPDSWLKAFVKLVAILRANEVHCVFIYDTSCPPEKLAERARRAEQKSKLEDRKFTLEEAVEKYNNSGIVDQYLLDFSKKRNIKPIKSLLTGSETINIKAIESALEKMNNQLFTLTPEDFKATRDILTLLDVPFFDAPMEAETMCADLCIQGKVDAVLTEDTDVLAYGTPHFLTKIDYNSGTCLRVEYEKLLSEMNLTSDQFLDFCIMCGCDYNENMYKVGPVKALSLLQIYGSIDSIGASDKKYDISVLNHIRLRELFREYQKFIGQVSYCGLPNFDELKNYLFSKGTYMDVDSLKKSFVKTIVVISSEEESERKKSEEKEEVLEEED